MGTFVFNRRLLRVFARQIERKKKKKKNNFSKSNENFQSLDEKIMNVKMEREEKCFFH